MILNRIVLPHFNVLAVLSFLFLPMVLIERSIERFLYFFIELGLYEKEQMTSV